MKVLEAQSILACHATLGEGSIWNSRRQVLHWVDIEGYKLHTYDPATGKDSSVSTSTYVSTVVPRANGDLVATVDRDIVSINESGAIKIIAQSGEPKTNRLNDGKVDPAGRFWFGSMNLKFEPKRGKLYMIDAEHKVHVKITDVGISNGIVWSSDKQSMYYIDTDTNNVDRFDYENESGTIGKRTTIISNKWLGHFDGMTIDSEDNLYVAIWGGGRVMKFDSRSGGLLAEIHAPGALNVTSCAFGGADLQDLYITTSKNATDINKFPHAGNLFKIRMDTAGVKAQEYQG